jgi:TatD DNase family protein
LDKLKGAPLADQINIFEQQIALAKQLNKPMIIHCVKAFAELIEIKKRLKVKIPMIIHGFNKKEALGKQLIDNGFFLSFGSALLQAGAGAASLIQSDLPFFLETDEAPISIVEIYETAANLKKCTVDELKACIFANWKKLNLIID